MENEKTAKDRLDGDMLLMMHCFQSPITLVP